MVTTRTIYFNDKKLIICPSTDMFLMMLRINIFLLFKIIWGAKILL